MKWKILGRFIGALAALLMASGAQAETIYTIQALNTLGGSSLAYGLNENGTVVGQSNNQAVIWSSNGSVQSLGFTGLARSVNNSGVVVGETGGTVLQNPTGRAFSWNAGTYTDLGDLGGANSGAYDINDSGVITGFSKIDPLGYAPAVHRTHAFIYENGVMSDLGALTTTTGYSRGHGINDANEIAGRASLVDFENSNKHAATWDANGNISSDPGPGNYSTAQQINNNGVVVGNAFDTSGVDRAAVWDSNGFHFMDDLGADYGRALSVNDAGTIVGWGFDAGFNLLATVSFDGQSVIDLNTLVYDLTGWSMLTEAYDVNELGQIVGYGTFNGEQTAFLLTPTAVPVPPAVWLFGSALGLLGWMRRRKVN